MRNRERRIARFLDVVSGCFQPVDRQVDIGLKVMVKIYGIFDHQATIGFLMWWIPPYEAAVLTLLEAITVRQSEYLRIPPMAEDALVLSIQGRVIVTCGENCRDC